MKYADVIVDISAEQLDRHFQYRIKEELEDKIRPGVRVEIPFGKGNKVRTGYVINVTDQAGYDPDKIKEICSLAEEGQDKKDALLDLAVWIRQSYGCTMIQALKTVLPVQKESGTRKQSFICLRADREELEALIGQARKKNHRARVRFLEALKDRERISLTEARNSLKVTKDMLGFYEMAGVIRILSDGDSLPMDIVKEKMPLPGLSREQQMAKEAIEAEWRQKEARPILLQGVTGSGKTYIYMSLIEDTLKAGRQAILLVPEIALTYQNVQRFYACFQEKVAILHSRLSPGERREQFERVRRGKASIMIGPRSALFAPFENLGLIIVDEEQEQSYKSEMTPRYHARETAIERARLEGAHVLLGSATPSLEAASRCESGLYRKVELKKRYGEHGLPRVYITDMREELKKGNRSVFGRQLMEELQSCLDRKEQALLFLNRRGYAGFVSCRSCGYVIKCGHCDVSMTQHRNGRLCCHYCGRSMLMPERCPSCQSPYISAFRAGTQQIEDILKKEFPRARILRMDTDTTRHKNDHERIVKAFHSHQADILIGTQMIVKGHDFPDVTLVGAIAADLSLYMADYRSAERTFQLLTQAVGRAGRGKKPGCAIIQTYHPEHYAIQAAAKQDYNAFYEEEMGYRSLMGYPPSGGLLSIHASCLDEDRLSMGMSCLKQFLERLPLKRPVFLIGPAGEAVAKINDRYRQVLYIKSEDKKCLQYIRDKAESYIAVNTGFQDMFIQYDYED